MFILIRVCLLISWLLNCCFNCQCCIFFPRVIKKFNCCYNFNNIKIKAVSLRHQFNCSIFFYFFVFFAQSLSWVSRVVVKCKEILLFFCSYSRSVKFFKENIKKNIKNATTVKKKYEKNYSDIFVTSIYFC